MTTLEPRRSTVSPPARLRQAADLAEDHPEMLATVRTAARLAVLLRAAAILYEARELAIRGDSECASTGAGTLAIAEAITLAEAILAVGASETAR
jgi:hypothetical protein